MTNALDLGILRSKTIQFLFGGINMELKKHGLPLLSPSNPAAPPSSTLRPNRSPLCCIEGSKAGLRGGGYEGHGGAPWRDGGGVAV